MGPKTDQREFEKVRRMLHEAPEWRRMGLETAFKGQKKVARKFFTAVPK